jgi:hypothetical protein
LRAGALLAVVLVAGCVGAPSPTAGQLVLARYPRASVAGRVVDADGIPVAGIGVEALPRGRDIPWSEPAVTDSRGVFELSLFAPADYAFLLHEGETCVVTDDPRDPSRAFIRVLPGERRRGIELVFLRERWKEILGSSQ